MQLFCRFHQKYYTGNTRGAPPKVARDAMPLPAVPPVHLPHHRVSARRLNLCAVVTVAEEAAHVKSDRAAACPCCHHCCSRALSSFLLQLLITHKPNAAQDTNSWFQTNALNAPVDKFVTFSALKGLKQQLTFRVFSSTRI